MESLEIGILRRFRVPNPYSLPQKPADCGNIAVP